MTGDDPALVRSVGLRRGRFARSAERALVIGLALGIAPEGMAQKPEPDPDSPEVHARAKEALTRADTREVSGETREITGLSLGIAGRAEDIAGLLRDLNAEVRGREVRIALSADVLFDFDKADLRPAAMPSLDKVVAVLKSYPKATATIEGHTDSKGDHNYNQKLSERRAESVRKWLAAHGASLRMTTRGWGEKKPVAPNAKPDGKDDPEGRQRNRRVDIIVKNE